MSKADLPQEDDVLRRMLATPPENHEPLGEGEAGTEARTEAGAKGNYLYRGGILCHSLGILVLGYSLLFLPEPEHDWYFISFILLVLASAAPSITLQKPD